MRILRPGLFIAVCASLCWAVPARSPIPDPASDPVIKMDSASCVIPFIRAGNLIVIKAKVDTIEGNFILDTGAPGLVLNLSYFRHYPSRSTGTDGGGITGSVGGNEGTMVDHVLMGGVHYYHVEADRINLGHIENNKGIRILGLLGMQLFTKFEMIIDYEKSVIFLHLISGKGSAEYRSEQLKDTTSFDELPIDITDYKIIVHTEMAGKRLLFLVDFGAESNVLDSRLPNKILENVTVTQRVLLDGSGARKVEALYGSLKNMRIGGRAVGDLPVLITNLQYMCTSYDHCLDGMLGFDFLSLHKIGFNFVRHKMYIWR
ncbi:MAG: pepsin/retropepsin-like aspartic protease family protein [Bacteroidota bacterium]|nr:pepsin/retropepsin-like aspartic protease family protein [Bacteroidota bacterium]MDP4218406.1 pepsin/retropepsin-like aspartic protease family protein [Bacteroidota bacterium]MDP4246258.1 pepsin/retropepsin-like aspartic protease family protein [Bacteroidota bacterium]MDP4256546.1 pepsin/retropepsin-like aspartic protease family protein [Bacteroidota bacterium]MDP4259830.1 pepsin/retropepsin-like aspartic protease family protein [Bacteroidota bacterium]